MYLRALWEGVGGSSVGFSFCVFRRQLLYDMKAYSNRLTIAFIILWCTFRTYSICLGVMVWILVTPSRAVRVSFKSKKRSSRHWTLRTPSTYQDTTCSVRKITLKVWEQITNSTTIIILFLVFLKRQIVENTSELSFFSVEAVNLLKMK